MDSSLTDVASEQSQISSVRVTAFRDPPSPTPQPQQLQLGFVVNNRSLSPDRTVTEIASLYHF